MTASVREVTPHKAPTAAQRLLEQPIVPTLARLAAPNMLSMLASTAVGIAESWYVGRLGTRALAGLALVFPMFMLMNMLAGGASVALSPRPSHVPWAPDNQNEPRPWHCMRWVLPWRQVASLWRCSSWAEQLFIRP